MKQGKFNKPTKKKMALYVVGVIFLIALGFTLLRQYQNHKNENQAKGYYSELIKFPHIEDQPVGKSCGSFQSGFVGFNYCEDDFYVDYSSAQIKPVASILVQQGFKSDISSDSITDYINNPSADLTMNNDCLSIDYKGNPLSSSGFCLYPPGSNPIGSPEGMLPRNVWRLYYTTNYSKSRGTI